MYVDRVRELSLYQDYFFQNINENVLFIFTDVQYIIFFEVYILVDNVLA